MKHITVGMHTGQYSTSLQLDAAGRVLTSKWSTKLVQVPSSYCTLQCTHLEVSQLLLKCCCRLCQLLFAVDAGVQ